MFTSLAAVTVAIALTGTCTPSDAWTETITVTPAVDAVAAVGTPTVEVPNPDYRPAVPGTPEVVEVSHVVHHDAVGAPTVTVPNPSYIPEVPGVPEVPEISHLVHHPAEYVHHDAESHVEYHFAKFTQTRSGTKDKRGDIVYGDFGPWTEWSPETHTSWQLSTDPLGQPEIHAEWSETTGQGKHKVTTYYQRMWQARFDGTTKTVTDKAAWDEKVKDAWDEKVIDQAYVPAVPGTPAVGEPTVEQPNPAYIPAWDETVIDVPYQAAVPGIPPQGDPTIDAPNPAYVPPVAAVPAVTRLEHHPAVVCPAPPAKEPAAVAHVSTVKPHVEAIAPAYHVELAETGGDYTFAWCAAGAAFLIVAAGACMVGMGATRHNRSQ